MEQCERDIDLDMVVPPSARNFPPKAKLLATRLYGFGKGVECGYKIAMLAPAKNNNASKE